MEFIDQIIEMIQIGIGILGLVLLAAFALVVVVVPILYIITRKERKQLLDEIKTAGGKLNHYLSKLESDSAQPLKVKKSINYNEDENELVVMPLSFVITENTDLLFLVNWKSHLTPGIGEYPSSHRKILFSQIKGFEFLVDSNKVYGNKITSAVVGGLFFGVVGAITGAIITDSKVKHKYTIYLTTNSLENPSFEIVCKDRNTAIEILSTFEILEELNNKSKNEL